jgi:GDP-4-dehydro-6-deoxy-D-mannose reductase
VRVLVTGAHGFVGRHLVAHLTSCGDDVVGVDRECDVTNAYSVERVLQESQPEAIYHLAALTHVGESWSNPQEYVRVNVLGTRNVLEAARHLATKASILYVSSADVYGIVTEAELPLFETHRAVPVNPYAQSKLEAELLVKNVARESAQRVVIVRPFNHVGPGQSPKFAVPALVSRLLEASANAKEEIAVGNLTTRRDFSDVRDVVKAYRLLVEFGHGGETYNVASGFATALSDIADDLVATIAPNVRLVPDEALFRPADVPVMRGSFEKLHEATGWEPHITLMTSLNDVISDMRTRIEEP